MPDGEPKAQARTLVGSTRHGAELGPYRAPPPDATSLGWIESRESRATTFVRQRGGALGAAAVLPLVIFARIMVGPIEQLSVFGWSVGIVLVLGVIAMWPLSRERICIDERGMRWRDRLLGHHARVPLDRLVVRVSSTGRRSSVAMGDGRASWRVAVGDAPAVEALAHALNAAIERARSPAAER